MKNTLRELIAWMREEARVAASAGAVPPDRDPGGERLEAYEGAVVMADPPEPPEAAVKRWLYAGAMVEAGAAGCRLTLPDGRVSVLSTEEGQRLPTWLQERLRDEAAECEAILRQSNWRPPAWAEAEEAPRPGDRCGCCKCGWWWRPARPRTDGLAPGPGWRCAVCRPAPPGCETAEVRT
jgi:hypothetical protein